MTTIRTVSGIKGRTKTYGKSKSLVTGYNVKTQKLGAEKAKEWKGVREALQKKFEKEPLKLKIKKIKKRKLKRKLVSLSGEGKTPSGFSGFRGEDRRQQRFLKEVGF